MQRSNVLIGLKEQFWNIFQFDDRTAVSYQFKLSCFSELPFFKKKVKFQNQIKILFSHQNPI
jgi:hypothetical protein